MRKILETCHSFCACSVTVSTRWGCAWPSNIDRDARCKIEILVAPRRCRARRPRRAQRPDPRVHRFPEGTMHHWSFLAVVTVMANLRRPGLMSGACRCSQVRSTAWSGRPFCSQRDLPSPTPAPLQSHCWSHATPLTGTPTKGFKTQEAAKSGGHLRRIFYVARSPSQSIQRRGPSFWPSVKRFLIVARSNFGDHDTCLMGKMRFVAPATLAGESRGIVVCSCWPRDLVA
jgi:hypothetical protein